jgi:hypothetical protein
VSTIVKLDGPVAAAGDGSPGVLRVSIDPGAEHSLGALPAALEALLSAAEALAAGGRVQRYGRDALPLRWPGADEAATQLVAEVLREQEGHHCCADSSRLLAQWCNATAPEAGDVRDRLRARLLERRGEDARHVAAWMEAHPPSVVSRATTAAVTGVLKHVLGLDLDASPALEVASRIGIDAGDVGVALHEVTGARLTLEAALRFQQGRYACECTCHASVADLVRLAAAIRDAVSALPGVAVAP